MTAFGLWVTYAPLIVCAIFLFWPKRALAARYGSDRVDCAAWSAYVVFVAWGIIVLTFGFLPFDLLPAAMRGVTRSVFLITAGGFLIARPSIPPSIALRIALKLPPDLQQAARASRSAGAMEMSLLAVRLLGGYCAILAAISVVGVIMRAR